VGPFSPRPFLLGLCEEGLLETLRSVLTTLHDRLASEDLQSVLPPGWIEAIARSDFDPLSAQSNGKNILDKPPVPVRASRSLADLVLMRAVIGQGDDLCGKDAADRPCLEEGGGSSQRVGLGAGNACMGEGAVGQRDEAVGG
ncbi:unnamed protein product, partial [Choristocarpus tenellus]